MGQMPVISFWHAQGMASRELSYHRYTTRYHGGPILEAEEGARVGPCRTGQQPSPRRARCHAVSRASWVRGGSRAMDPACPHLRNGTV